MNRKQPSNVGEAGNMNKILFQAIRKRWPSVGKFCKELKFTPSIVGKLINKKVCPWQEKKGRYWPIAEKLAAALGFSALELFPPELYGFRINLDSKSPKMLFMGNLSDLTELSNQLEDNPETLVMKKELMEFAGKIIRGLNPKKAKVMEMRLADCTLEEISASLGLTRQRIFQIESGAVKLLQRLVLK